MASTFGLRRRFGPGERVGTSLDAPRVGSLGGLVRSATPPATSVAGALSVGMATGGAADVNLSDVVLVAASNAPAAEIAAANYVCDGTDDDVEINQALADAQDRRRVVRLSTGIFYVAQPIEVVQNTAKPSPEGLVGAGYGATSILWGKNSGSFDFDLGVVSVNNYSGFDYPHLLVADFTIGPDTGKSGKHEPASSLYLSGYNIRVSGVVTASGMDAAFGGLYLGFMWNLVVEDCQFASPVNYDNTDDNWGATDIDDVGTSAVCLNSYRSGFLYNVRFVNCWISAYAADHWAIFGNRVAGFGGYIFGVQFDACNIQGPAEICLSPGSSGDTPTGFYNCYWEIGSGLLGVNYANATRIAGESFSGGMSFAGIFNTVFILTENASDTPVAASTDAFIVLLGAVTMDGCVLQDDQTGTSFTLPWRFLLDLTNISSHTTTVEWDAWPQVSGCTFHAEGWSTSASGIGGATVPSRSTRFIRVYENDLYAADFPVNGGAIISDCQFIGTDDDESLYLDTLSTVVKDNVWRRCFSTTNPVVTVTANATRTYLTHNIFLDNSDAPLATPITDSGTNTIIA